MERRFHEEPGVVPFVKFPQMLQDRIFKALDLDALESKAEVMMLDLFPPGHVNGVLEDGTKVWLAEAERHFPRIGQDGERRRSALSRHGDVVNGSG